MFKGVDHMSPIFNKMGKSSLGFGAVLKGVLGAQIIQKGIMLLTSGIKNASDQFVIFDQTIVGAASRFKDLEVGTDKTNQVMIELKKTARDIGAQTQFTSVQAAEGLNFFAKAGFTSAEAMSVLKSQVDLATVAEQDFSTTADITSDLLGSFGLNASNSAKKIENLKRLTNSLGLATNMANVDLNDLFESLKISAPVATAAGESMNTIISMTAALGSAGIKGSMGATAVKNAYLFLSQNSAKVKKSLASVGLSLEDFVDQKTGALNMTKALRMIGAASDKLGKPEQLALFGKIFGREAVAGAINLSKSLQDVAAINSVLGSGKSITDIADQIRGGLGMQIEIIKSGLLELGFQFIETFEGDARAALSYLIKAVSTFDMKKITDGIKKVISIFKTFEKPVRNIIDKVLFLGKTIWDILIGSLKNLLKPVGGVNGGLNILAGILSFVSGFISAFASGIQFLSPLLKILIPIAAGVTAAVWLLNIAMSANPISLIIIGVAALIAGIGLLIQNFDTVKKVVFNVFGAIGKFFTDVFGAIGNIFVDFYETKIKPIVDIFLFLSEIVGGVLKSAFDGLWSFIKPIVDGIGKFITDVGGFFGKIGKGVGDFFTGKKEKESPNQIDAQTRQRSQWEGSLNINGAPAGSTFDQKSKGAPPLKYALLGPNK
jgi:TP901 family phage tail tape measure protein